MKSETWETFVDHKFPLGRQKSRIKRQVVSHCTGRERCHCRFFVTAVFFDTCFRVNCWLLMVFWSNCDRLLGNSLNWSSLARNRGYGVSFWGQKDHCWFFIRFACLLLLIVDVSIDFSCFVFFSDGLLKSSGCHPVHRFWEEAASSGNRILGDNTRGGWKSVEKSWDQGNWTNYYYVFW